MIIRVSGGKFELFVNFNLFLVLVAIVFRVSTNELTIDDYTDYSVC